MVGPSAWAIAATVALVGAPEPGQATPPASIELEWDAPPPCPSAADIQARYAELLGHAPRGHGTMYARGLVVQAREVWTLRLTTTFEGVVDERELQSATCETLGEATATMFALVLEPTLAASSGPPPAAAPQEPETLITPGAEAEAPLDPVLSRRALEPVDTPDQPAPAVKAPPRRRSRDLKGLVRPAAGVEYGALPGVTPSVALAGGLLLPRVRVELEALWLAPRSTRGPGRSVVTAQSILGGAHGCLRLRASRLEFPVCAGLEAGLVRGTASGVQNARIVRTLWLAPSARAAVVYGRERWGLLTGVGLAPRLYATRLRVDDQLVFTPFPVSFRGVVGLEIYFSAPPR